MTNTKSKAQPKGRSAKRSRRSRSGKGVLLFVTLLLATSGVFRLAGEPNHVLAQGLKGLIDDEAPPAADSDTSCTPPPEISSVLEALDVREARIEEREGALADRLASLSLAEAEIQKNLIKLQEAEERLTNLMALSDGAAEGDLARLTAVYEAMKPKDAAILFQEMAPDFAAGFLGRMRPDLAASVMAGLDPETAYTISVILAGRNANAPTE